MKEIRRSLGLILVAVADDTIVASHYEFGDHSILGFLVAFPKGNSYEDEQDYPPAGCWIIRLTRG